MAKVILVNNVDGDSVLQRYVEGVDIRTAVKVAQGYNNDPKADHKYKAVPVEDSRVLSGGLQ